MLSSKLSEILLFPLATLDEGNPNSQNQIRTSFPLCGLTIKSLHL